MNSLRHRAGLLLAACLAAACLLGALASPAAPAPPAAPAAAAAGGVPAPADPSLGGAGAVAGGTVVVIRAGAVLDGRGGALGPATVIVEGSRIREVVPGAGGDRDRTGAVVYDLSGMTLMPGGIDTHVHIGWHFGAVDGKLRDGPGADETPAQSALYAAENAAATVRGGITTVQSLGAAEDRELRAALARGGIPGPRLLSSLTPLDEDSGAPEAMRAALRKLAADGADVVKIFASKSIRDGGGPTLSQEQLAAACGEVRARGLRSAVHAHGVESVRRAVAAGCTSIEHGTLLDAATLRLLAEHGTYLDPNIDLVFRNYFENQPHFLGIGNFTAEGFAQMRQAVPRALAMFRLALATPGLKVVFGTDAVAGAHGRNFEELVYRVEKGGQDPMAALVSATSLAAESLRLGDRIGTVAPGFDADLIALRGDPRRDIRALQRVAWVMRAGRVVRNDLRRD